MALLQPALDPVEIVRVKTVVRVHTAQRRSGVGIGCALLNARSVVLAPLLFVVAWLHRHGSSQQRGESGRYHSSPTQVDKVMEGHHVCFWQSGSRQRREGKHDAVKIYDSLSFGEAGIDKTKQKRTERYLGTCEALAEALCQLEET